MGEKYQEVTFEVYIKEVCNYSWQGKVKTNGKTMLFKSDLELLLLMDRLVNENCQVSSL